MRANSNFATAVHILTLLALSKGLVSSSRIAQSVNTNPVVIRQIIQRLRCAGLVRTEVGRAGGATLQRNPAEISLAEVYNLFREDAFFNLHPSTPNPLCPVGRNIQAVLLSISSEAEELVVQALSRLTIADVLARVAEREAHLASGANP